MPSIFSHAIAGAAIAQVAAPPAARGWLTAACAVCAMVPDADVIAFRLKVPYGSAWGHRGMTHSFLFAAVLAGVVLLSVWKRFAASDRPGAFLCLFFATASHGLLDAMTNGGLGVALFAPFDSTRFFFPFRPIEVSPIGLRNFLTAKGLTVILSEFLWIWIPALAVIAAARRYHSREASVASRSRT